MDIFFPVIGYLVGSIPFGLIIGRLAGIDVRKEGSCNIGATNVSRVLGKKLGLVTLVCDCLKGLLPMALAGFYLPDTANREQVVALTGVLAVVGHMFSIYLRFSGGKGVATGLGVFLYFSPLAIAVSLAVFLAAVRLTGFVSVGSLLASALIPLWLYLLGAAQTTVWAATVIALLIWGKHHENINRLLHGQEKTWKKSKTEKV
jgi:glycerol-3-phosphate acyltransferase PlsY